MTYGCTFRNQFYWLNILWCDNLIIINDCTNRKNTFVRTVESEINTVNKTVQMDWRQFDIFILCVEFGFVFVSSEMCALWRRPHSINFCTHKLSLLHYQYGHQIPNLEWSISNGMISSMPAIIRASNEFELQNLTLQLNLSMKVSKSLFNFAYALPLPHIEDYHSKW